MARRSFPFRMVAWLLVALIMVCVFSSVGLTAEKLTLVLWDQFTEEQSSRAVDKLIAQFVAANPGVEFKRNPIGGTDMRKTLKTALVAGTGPDLFYYESGGRLSELVYAGLVYDLTPTYSRLGWDKRVAASASELVTINARVWGVPNERELNTGIFYRKSDFARMGLAEPKTYEEFLHILDAYRSHGLTPLAVGNAGGKHAWRLFTHFLDSYAGRAAVEDVVYGDGSWVQPAFVAAASKTLDFAKKEYILPNPNAISADEARMAFVTRKAGLLLTGSWDIRRLYEEDPNPDDIDVFLVPALTPDVPTRPIVGLGSAFYISASIDPRKLEAAVKFYDFLLSDQAAKVWFEEVKVIPAVMVDLKALDIPLSLRRVVDMLRAPQGAIKNIGNFVPPDVLSEGRSTLEALWAGRTTAEDAMKSIQKVWQKAKAEGRVIKVR